MKGIHKVVVGTKYLKYEFELRRNLTIIRGDSATGKTTLVDMIRTHMNDGESGPVSYTHLSKHLFTQRTINGKVYELPFEAESDGTKKMIARCV